jgi:S-DNA-T family DNA segregation ATPase FtsK/SpoIIIE
MARKKRQKQKKLKWEHGLKEETIYAIWSILFFFITIFLSLSPLDLTGVVGKKLYSGLTSLIGIGYYLLPILSLLLAISFLKAKRAELFAGTKVIGAIIFFVSGLGLIEIAFDQKGGIVGHFVKLPLVKFFDVTPSAIFLIALILISILIIFNTSIRLPNISLKRKPKEEVFEEVIEEPEEEIYEGEIEEEMEEEPEKVEGEKESKFSLFKGKEKVDEFQGISITKALGKAFTPPPISLLSKDKGKPGVGDIKANSNIIKRTLSNFGIEVEMDEISVGPSVTRYTLKPAEGVKLSRIIGLQNDLSLALAAHPIRIEAPIPGKSLVGIEVPNSAKTTVGLGTLIDTDEFKNAKKPLTVTLGKDVTGKVHWASIYKMPHLLIAGSTGSGKSVTIHAVINSLLFSNSPDNLKFLMVDPKRVELTLYNGIPHLLTPVITDAKKTILALKWAINEMDRRYDILEAESVRDIQSYHNNILKPAIEKWQKNPEEEAPQQMPYIVIVIDELADIMATYPRELESGIVRLAQMSRAVGIHLILSTQRPSVNIITGLIKANVPARIALQVASQVDSRTILDASGAEKLLGAGDMLYISGEMSKPQRLQSAFISESEVKDVVKFLKKSHQDELNDEIVLTEEQVENNIFSASLEDDDSEEDDLYEEARETVIAAGKASTSYLQRKLRIGYARAARLMDILEDRGIIGPADGSKPRDVIVEE